MNRKRYGRKRLWPNLRYHPGIFLEGSKKTTKNLSQDSRSPGKDLNTELPENERMLTIRQRRSIEIGVKCNESGVSSRKCPIACLCVEKYEKFSF
jgi:hypothetical protein